MISEDSTDLPEGWTRFRLRRRRTGGTGVIYDRYVKNPEGIKFDRQEKIDQYLIKIQSDLKVSFMAPPTTSNLEKTTDMTKYMIKAQKAPKEQPELCADLNNEEEIENLRENLTKERTFVSEKGMGSLSLVEMYDELRIGEIITRNEIGKDDLFTMNMLDSLENKSKMTEDLNLKLKEAERKNFQLEQKIRTLLIQLEEEKEAKVDLEIENIKLRKDLTNLKKSLESINNNCYDDVSDLNLSEVSLVSEDNDITIIGGDNSLVHDLSDFKLLSDETLDHSPFSSTAATNMLLLEREVPSPLLLSTVKKCPPASCVKKTSDTYTKKIHNMPPPVVTISVSRALDSTTTKKARRRSKSVDFHIGEKTMIVPEACELCVHKAQRQRGAEDSPTLPWCPHQNGVKDVNAISVNATPIRSMMFKNVLSGGKMNQRVKDTSTPLVKSILKLPKSTVQGRVRNHS